MSEIHMREDIVMATLEALQRCASAFLCEYKAGIHAEDYRPPELKIGASVHGNIRVDFTRREVGELLGELRQIENRLGFDARFGGRQINLLAMAWRQLHDTMPAEPGN